MVAHAARALGRPVKWSRPAHRGIPRRPCTGATWTCRAELALDADGRALALRVRSLANVGACPARAAWRSSC